MNTLQFKTSINCANCVKIITPILNDNKNIESWQVDTTVDLKTLSINGNISPEDIISLVQEAGFTIEPLSK